MSHILYQHGTLGTLMAGLLEGTATIDGLLRHGDLGLTALTGSDGEVVFTNGEAHHANEKEELVKLKGDELTPFTTITEFETGRSYETSNKDSETALSEVKEHILSDSLFSTVEVTGRFKKIHVRMILRQEPPYTRLIDSACRQPGEIQEDANGTVTGFFTPELFHGAGSSDFHVHFTNDDRNFGGHILDFEADGVRIEVRSFETLEQHFLIDSKTLVNAEVDYTDTDAEIREAG